jgi:hypothetical protein
VFTLVRHNLWTIERFPLFFRGLEPIVVGPRAALAVVRSGGVLFRSYDQAWDAAEGFMYPTGDTTIPADPSGSFREVFFLPQPLFVPVFSGDLIAA